MGTSRIRNLCIFIFLLLLLCGTACAEDLTASGICGVDGDNLTWKLESDWTITISGEGDMADFDNIVSRLQPWRDYEYSIRKVVVEEGVSSVGNQAFDGCISLAEIDLPSSLRRIGRWAFSGGNKLTELSLPDNLNIEFRAFEHCGKLKSVTFEGGNVHLEEEVFYDCIGLQAVYISDLSQWLNIRFNGSRSNPVSYAQNLYVGGELLQTLVLPKGITEIHSNAFRGCSSINYISFPQGLTSIAPDAFGYCTGLTEIILPDSVNSIGYLAFVGCSGLKRIEIPANVNFIGERAFNDCTALTEVIIAGSSTVLSEQAFAACDSLRNLLFSAQENNAPDLLAFEGCAPTVYCYAASDARVWAQECGYDIVLLDDVDIREDGVLTLPAGVKTIEAEAFSNTPVCQIILPDGCESIASRAFANCSRLVSITMPDSVTFIAEDAFEHSARVTFICESMNAAQSYAEAHGLNWIVV